VTTRNMQLRLRISLCSAKSQEVIGSCRLLCREVQHIALELVRVLLMLHRYLPYTTAPDRLHIGTGSAKGQR